MASRLMSESEQKQTKLSDSCGLIHLSFCFRFWFLKFGDIKADFSHFSAREVTIQNMF